MAVAIGGRALAIYAVGGTLQAVNQSTWQTTASAVAQIIGQTAGMIRGVGFNAFLDVLSDGTDSYIRLVFDDVQVQDGTSVATAVAAFRTACENGTGNIKFTLAAFSSLGTNGITLSSVSFEPWGNGWTP